MTAGADHELSGAVRGSSTHQALGDADMASPSHGVKLRGLERIVAAQRAVEGGGFEVFRPFPTDVLDLLDPFLLLDEMAPKYTPPGSAPIGAPDHPHRGFETVTYMLAGEAEHRDSAGNQGIIGPGDVQWMTAGDGIVHSEMPSTAGRRPERPRRSSTKRRSA